MSEGIIIALIGLGATIAAALIGLLVKTNVTKKKSVIKQNQEGKNNTQIGIQINKGDGTDV